MNLKLIRMKYLVEKYYYKTSLDLETKDLNYFMKTFIILCYIIMMLNLSNNLWYKTYPHDCYVRTAYKDETVNYKKQ